MSSEQQSSTNHHSTSVYHSLSTGSKIPPIIYGTAWKKDKTTDLVIQAITAGFRGIDTACQPKHYREELTGAALEQLYKQGIVKREDIFLQTKFTSMNGQDPNQPLPYNPKDSLPDQVRESFTTSLKNLKTDYIDCYILHSPLQSHSDTMSVWRVFEELFEQGKVKHIGISNIYSASSLAKIVKEAKIKPHVIQNRFYQDSDYDKEIRKKICSENNIRYESFWSLTANPQILQHENVVSIAQKKKWTPAQTWYRFLIQRGIVPLDGTKSQEHMRQDLEVSMKHSLDGDLSESEMKSIGGLFGEDILQSKQ